MKIDYSISEVLNGGGIGSVAYHHVKYLIKNGSIGQVIATGVNDVDIPKNLLKESLFLRNFFKILGSANYRLLSRYLRINLPVNLYKSLFFDRFVKKHLRRSKSQVFHFWPSLVFDSIQTAKQKGMLISTEGSSTHPFYFCRIMNEEFTKQGLNFQYKSDNILTQRGVFGLSNADVIFASSEFVVESMLEMGIDKEKLYLNPFGVDTKRFRPNWKKDKFRFVFVGSVMYRKGIHYLLEAYEKLNLPDTELLVCGSIHNEIRPLIKKYQPNRNIRFVDWVDTAEVLPQASVFVFPSIEEGSALVTYEAMASGLPLITTEHSGSVAKDNEHGFIIPIRDVNALMDRMEYSYRNPNKMIDMGKAAHRKIQQYTWEKHASDRIAVYKDKL